MFSKKLILGLIGILFSLNFGLYGVGTSLPASSDTKLSSCLNLIHQYHDYNLISNKYDELANKYDELAKTKSIITNVFLMGLAIPEASLNDSLRPKIQEILKSGDSEQKEIAITSLNYLMFDYRSDITPPSCEENKAYFDRVSKLLLHEQKLFLKLCIDLINNANTDINVSKACYEFFMQYFLNSEYNLNSVDLNRVVEIGLKNNDRFIKICALALNVLADSDWSDAYSARIKSNFNTTDFLIKMRSETRKLSRFGRRCGCKCYSREEYQQFLKGWSPPSSVKPSQLKTA